MIGLRRDNDLAARDELDRLRPEHCALAAESAKSTLSSEPRSRPQYDAGPYASRKRLDAPRVGDASDQV